MKNWKLLMLFFTKARGVGLGLVVKNLTEANGDSVKVQREVGKGTLFFVTLPVADKVLQGGCIAPFDYVQDMLIHPAQMNGPDDQPTFI